MGLDNVLQILVLGLMMVFIFAVIYSQIEITYKIGIGALVFSIIFIASLANQALKQQRDEDKRRRR